MTFGPCLGLDLTLAEATLLTIRLRLGLSFRQMGRRCSDTVSALDLGFNKASA